MSNAMNHRVKDAVALLWMRWIRQVMNEVFALNSDLHFVNELKLAGSDFGTDSFISDFHFIVHFLFLSFLYQLSVFSLCFFNSSSSLSSFPLIYPLSASLAHFPLPLSPPEHSPSSFPLPPPPLPSPSPPSCSMMQVVTRLGNAVQHEPCDPPTARAHAISLGAVLLPGSLG